MGIKGRKHFKPPPRPTPEEETAQYQALVERIYHRLLRVPEGFVWITMFGRMFPAVHMVRYGRYYGFVACMRNGLTADGSHFAAEVRRAGGMCAVVRNMADLNGFITREFGALLENERPDREKVRMWLRSWGDGKRVRPGLEAAIQKLPPSEREVIYGRYLDRLTCAQIALKSSTRVSAAGVERSEREAVDRLRDALAGVEESL